MRGRKKKCLTHNGRTLTVTEWSDLTGICTGTIFVRLHKGWSVSDALFTPIKKKAPRYQTEEKRIAQIERLILKGMGAERTQQYRMIKRYYEEFKRQDSLKVA